jgi:lipopolysaccharide export system protein LptC
MSAIEILSSLRGPYSFYRRIADAEIAGRSAVAAEKTDHAALGTQSMHVTTETNYVTTETKRDQARVDSARAAARPDGARPL